jgi:hypothetical protein
MVRSLARWLGALAVSAWSVALATPGTKGEGAKLTEVRDGRYRVGQVWRFTPRFGEEGATLTVVKVESAPEVGVIVHVSLAGVHVRSPRAPGGFNDRLPHAPFTETAIAKSVTVLVGEVSALPPFERGYAEWRRAFDAGKGGIFTIPVAEAVEAAERAMAAPLHP